MTRPDFAALRAARDEARRKMLAAICAEHGLDPATAHVHFSASSGCYCACPDGPCEHEFEGSRDILDSNDDVIGAETACRLCGLGAMSHTHEAADLRKAGEGA